MISVKISQELATQIEKDFINFKVENNNEYVSFFARSENVNITIYHNKKDEYKATFQGPQELEFVKLYIPDFVLEEKEERKINQESKEYLDKESQIGSDEVGFGDFFGPVVVCATYFDKSYNDIIIDYGIKDSKKLTDKKILEIVPKFIDKVDYSLLVVDNEKLNELFNSGKNLNEIKAILHNQALYNVYLKHKNALAYYVDQFCSPENYYKYNKEQKNILFNIHFETKGESKYPSVALASVIARYAFLKYMQNLNEKYNVEIPLGASSKVDEFAKKFIEDHSIDELDKIVKKKYINYKNLFKLF